MKKNIRSKISGFLTSEDGRVSTKAPLTLGVVTGSVLLAQAMIPSLAQAELVIDDSCVTCKGHHECEDDEVCAFWSFTHEPGPTIELHTACIVPPDD